MQKATHRVVPLPARKRGEDQTRSTRWPELVPRERHGWAPAEEVLSPGLPQAAQRAGPEPTGGPVRVWVVRKPLSQFTGEAKQTVWQAIVGKESPTGATRRPGMAGAAPGKRPQVNMVRSVDMVSGLPAAFACQRVSVRIPAPSCPSGEPVVQ